METHQPTRRLGHRPVQATTGLSHNTFGAFDDGAEVVDRPVQLAFALPDRSAQRPAGIADHRGGLAHGSFGDAGQFTGDPPHRSLRLVALLLAA